MFAKQFISTQLPHTPKKKDHAGFKPRMVKEEMKIVLLIAMSREESQDKKHLNLIQDFQTVKRKAAMRSAMHPQNVELTCSAAHTTKCVWIKQPDPLLDQTATPGKLEREMNQKRNQMKLTSHTDKKKDGAMIKTVENQVIKVTVLLIRMKNVQLCVPMIKNAVPI